MVFNRRAFLAASAALPAAACASNAGVPLSRAADELAWIDATATADLIRKREITAREAVAAAIERCEALNPQLNFLVTKDYERALALADQPRSGPFAGTPLLVKDLNDVAGVPTRWGSRVTAAAPIPQTTDPTIEAYVRAGFIPFGKTQTPEYGFLPTTEPVAFGPARNPWNVARSTGGSSGGSAAATAAGVVPVGHANDGGGSVRIPASCCGLFGLKPTRGRTIGDKVGPLELSTEQCVARSVRDAAAVFAAIERTGPDANLPPVGFVTTAVDRRLKIGFTTSDPMGRTADRDVAEGVMATAALLSSMGHAVEEAAWPMGGEQFADDFTALWTVGAARLVAGLTQQLGRAPGEAELEPFTLGLARMNAEYPRDAFDLIGQRLVAAGQKYLSWYDTYDVVLTPVLASAPPEIGHLAPTVDFETLKARLRDYVGYTPVQNLAGNPAMSVPLWWTRERLPVGMHFSARTGGERTLFELAYQLEAARPWARKRPTISA